MNPVVAKLKRLVEEARTDAPEGKPPPDGPRPGDLINTARRHRDPLKKIARIRDVEVRAEDAEDGQATYYVEYPDGERGPFVSRPEEVRILRRDHVKRYVAELQRVYGSSILRVDEETFSRALARVKHWQEKRGGDQPWRHGGFDDRSHTNRRADDRLESEGGIDL